MAVDFFNNDVIRGDNHSGKEYSEAIQKQSTGEDIKPDHNEMNKPDFFKDDKIEEVEKVMAESESESEIAEPIEEVKQPTIKELMAVYGEKEYRMPADAKFKHKVAGEEVEVNLQELLNNYSGKGGWEKKFSELDKDRQAYKKDLETVNKYLGTFAEKAKTDRVGAFEFLAEAVGIDPLEFRKGMRKDLLSKHSDYLSMDEQTRSAYEMKEENEYFKSKHAAEKKRQVDEQARVEFESHISSLKTQHNISDDKLNELVSDLREFGGIDKPSMDDIIALNSAYIRQDRAADVLNKVNPDLLKDDTKLSTVESLLAGNPKLDDKELYEYVSKLWGNDISKAVASLNKKTAKKETIKPQIYKPKLMAPGRVDFFND